MTSFELSPEDLFFLSVTANGMFLLSILTSRLVELTIYLLRGRCWLATYMGEINRNRPGLVGRMLFEHLCLWTLVILVVICLQYSSVTSHPFVFPHHSARADHLLGAVLYISTTRSVFLVGRLALARDVHVLQDHAKSRTSLGPTGNTKGDLAYAVFDAGAKFVGLAFRQNLFLSISSVLYELNSTTLDFSRLMELVRVNLSSRTLHSAMMLNVITCVLCRVVLPIVFLLVALLNQSPLAMDTIPLVWFFASGPFHFILHSHSLYQSVCALIKPLPEILPRPQTYRTSQSGPSVLEALSNDIHEDSTAPSGKARDGSPLFKSFNYVFIRSYDNRNLACVYSDESSEKMNILKRKDVSKSSLLYKPRRCEENTLHDKAPPTGPKDDLNNQLDVEFTTDESLLGSPLEDYREEEGPSSIVIEPLRPNPDTGLEGEEYGRYSSRVVS